MNRRFISQLAAEQRALKLFNRYYSSSFNARLNLLQHGNSKRLLMLTRRSVLDEKSLLPPIYFGSSLFHSQTSVLRKDPESNAEKMSNLLKENIMKPDEPEKKKPVTTTTTTTTTTPLAEGASAEVKADEKLAVDTAKPKEVKPRLTLWQKIVAECKHYYHGFKLLYFETKIAWRLFKQVLNGHTLTRRERKQVNIFS